MPHITDRRLTGDAEAGRYPFAVQFGLKSFVTDHHRLLMLLAVAAMTIYRAPSLLIEPRVWAEEGRFLGYALNHSVLRALLYTNPDSGYYLLSADVPAVLSALVSKWLGLQYAPFVSSYFSLFFQLIPFAILVFGKSHLFSTPLKISAGCLLILFAPSTYGMIWFNTINSLSWAGMASLVLLFEDTSAWSRRRRYAVRVGLVLLGLCGPYVPIMFPLFILAAFFYRDKEHLIQSALLVCCTVMQFGVYVVTRHSGGAVSRFAQATLDGVVVNGFYFFVLSAIFGEAGASKVSGYLGISESLHGSAYISKGQPNTLAAHFSALVLVLLLSTLWNKIFRSQNTLVLVSFLYLATFTAATAAYGIPSDRYMFIPGFAFLLFLLTTAWSDQRTLIRVLCGVALLCSVWVGARDYTTYWHDLRITSPPWIAEVQRWQTDKDYQPRVWPDWFPRVFEWNPKRRK